MITGIDYHKRYLVATTMTGRGRVVREERVETKREELEEFIAGLGRGARVALEATGTWYAFYELLEEKDIEVTLAHPLKTRAIAEAKIKTDKIDARTLADLLRANLLPKAYIPPREVRDLREVLRYRASLVAMRTSVKNRIHAVLGKLGMTIRWRNVLGKKAAVELRGLAVRECYRVELDGYLRLGERLGDLLGEMDTHLATLVQDNPQAQLLQTIPGIGYYSGLLIVSEIGDVHRFPTAKRLCSYAGLVPSVHSSGGHTRYGRLTKQGSRWLRWILIEVAHHVIEHDERLRALATRVSRKYGKNVGKTAVARELLKIIFYMLRDHRPFEHHAPGRLHGVMASR